MEGFTSKYTDEQMEALLDVVAEGGGESASAMEYLDMSGTSTKVKNALLSHACYVKGYLEDYDAYLVGGSLYGFSQMTSNLEDSVSAIAIDFSNVVVTKVGDTFQRITIAEAALQNEATQADIDAIPRITKEEFYTI